MLDDFNRERLGIEIDFSLPSERVARTLNRIIEWRGVALRYIQPGKPQQNANVERYNRTVLRQEWLGRYI